MPGSNCLRVLLILGVVTLCTAARADVVGASFRGQVVTIYENQAGLSIEVGHILSGHVVIDTSQATLTTPGAPYADYSVTDGAKISVYIAGREFQRAIDFINVTNDRPAYTSDSVIYLDRFFVSGYDTNASPSQGSQLWLDESRAYSIGSPVTLPTLVSSMSIPSPLSLNLGITTGSTWLVYEPEIRVAGWLTAFEPFNVPLMFEQLLATAEAEKVSKALIKKLALAQTYYEAGDAQAAEAFLDDFVTSLRRMILGKRPKIVIDVASRLIGDAEAVKAAIKIEP